MPKVLPRQLEMELALDQDAEMRDLLKLAYRIVKRQGMLNEAIESIITAA